VHFNYEESIPTARALARKVIKALGCQDEDINPMSVHSVQKPEIPEDKRQNNDRRLKAVTRHAKKGGEEDL